MCVNIISWKSFKVKWPRILLILQKFINSYLFTTEIMNSKYFIKSETTALLMIKNIVVILDSLMSLEALKNIVNCISDSKLTIPCY
jgi:hypothetical protein